MKKIVKKETRVTDFDEKEENLYFFTDKTLKVSYNIIVENHHDTNVNSIITIDQILKLLVSQSIILVRYWSR